MEKKVQGIGQEEGVNAEKRTYKSLEKNYVENDQYNFQMGDQRSHRLERIPETNLEKG